MRLKVSGRLLAIPSSESRRTCDSRSGRPRRVQDRHAHVTCGATAPERWSASLQSDVTVFALYTGHIRRPARNDKVPACLHSSRETSPISFWLPPPPLSPVPMPMTNDPDQPPALSFSEDDGNEPGSSSKATNSKRGSRGPFTGPSYSGVSLTFSSPQLAIAVAKSRASASPETERGARTAK